ncbi:hypothetical protein HDU81_001792 [Chytriomyces hyalinus]|nr:hypothetical protein HDU81_001792 [Chytriomyces hyalinus]
MARTNKSKEIRAHPGGRSGKAETGKKGGGGSFNWVTNSCSLQLLDITPTDGPLYISNKGHEGDEWEDVKDDHDGLIGGLASMSASSIKRRSLTEGNVHMSERHR